MLRAEYVEALAMYRDQRGTVHADTGMDELERSIRGGHGLGAVGAADVTGPVYDSRARPLNRRPRLRLADGWNLMTIYIQQLMKQVEDVRDRFHAAAYVDGDVEAALACVSDGCELRHLPAGSGASGRDELRRYLTGLVRPADLAFRRLSRTTDRWRVADETRVSFTFDRELAWLLPGVTPTRQPVELLAVSVTEVQRGAIRSVRTIWDVSPVRPSTAG